MGFGLILAAIGKLAAMEQDATVKKGFTVSPIVEVRERFERRTNKSFSQKVPTNRSDVFNRDRLGFAYSDGGHLSGQVVYEYTSDTHWQYSGNGSLDTSDLLLGYLSDKQNWGDVMLGRQRISIGNQRILGESDWKVASNSWDAVRFQGGNTDLFTGRLAVSTYESEDSRLIGGDYDSPLGKTLGFFAHDRIGASSTDIYTLDQRYTGRAGGLDLDLEGAFQYGKVGSLDNRAWALDARVNRKFNKKFSGYIDAAAFSGGKTGSSDLEFSVPYGTKHSFGGYADVQGSDNVKWLSAETAYQATPRVGLELVYYKFWLYDDRDAWMSKNFVANKVGSVSFIDPTGGKGSDLGQEIDFVTKWSLDKTTELSAGASDYILGDFQKAFISSANRNNQLWFFAQVSFKFHG